MDLAWYNTLVKPPLTPPAAIFGPVWTLLYILIAISFIIVLARGFKVRHQLRFGSKKPWNRYSRRLWEGSWQKFNIIAVFLVQLVLNLIWSPIFFGLHNIGLAFFELLALWCSVVYLVANFYRVSKLSAYLLLPYLLWITFAGYLNFAFWILNK